MNNIKKLTLWFYLLNKRLLKKTSFIIILSLIPILVFAMAFLSRDESGVLSVTVCNESNGDLIADEIVEKLKNDAGVIDFKFVDSSDKAEDAVKTGQTDAAWIFHKDLSAKINEYVTTKNKKEPFMTVIERESDIALQLSHEKLFGLVFPYMSYSLFEDFMANEVFDEGEISTEEIKEGYDTAIGGGNLVVFEKIDGSIKEVKSNYLTAPLRGLLILVVLLCGLSAVMYYQSDRERGIYDWLSNRKHILFGTLLCASAVFDACVAVVVALVFSELFVSFWIEICAILMFVPAVTAFCMLVGVITRKTSRTGQIIPFLMIIALVISPIFFNLSSLRVIQSLLPTYYYLYAVYNPIYILYMALYSVVTFTVVYLLNRAVERN